MQKKNVTTMNTKMISIIAIFLWGITVLAGIFFFMKGKTITGDDNRTAVVLTHSEKIMVLGEMRQMLGAVHGILQGLNEGNMKKVEEAALSGGTAHMVDMNPAFMMKLPGEFKQVGMKAHTDFDSIGAAAKNGASEKEIMKMLSESMNGCVSCHAKYQITTE